VNGASTFGKLINLHPLLLVGGPFFQFVLATVMSTASDAQSTIQLLPRSKGMLLWELVMGVTGKSEQKDGAE
jgi:hypothetical protein